MLRDRSLRVYPTYSFFLASWIYKLIFFTEFRKFGPFFFQVFFLPLSVSLLLDFHYTYVVMLADVTQVSEALGFCFLFFSFCSSYWIIPIVLFLSSLILFSDSSEFFISATLFFNTRISIFLFNNLSIFIDIL